MVPFEGFRRLICKGDFLYNQMCEFPPALMPAGGYEVKKRKEFSA